MYAASRLNDWAKIVECHLLDVMYLVRNSEGGISYREAMTWPRWKVRSRCLHIGYWIEEEDKATRAAQGSR